MTHSRSWNKEIWRTRGWKCYTRAAPSCDIFNLGFVIFSCPTHYRASSVKCRWTWELGSNNATIQEVNSAFFAKSVGAKLLYNCYTVAVAQITQVPPCAATLHRPVYESSFWTSNEVHETSEIVNIRLALNAVAAPRCSRARRRYCISRCYPSLARLLARS